MISYFDSPHRGNMADITARVGGKGASLWAMTTQLGLPVPPGFTIAAGTVRDRLTDAQFADVLDALSHIGRAVGRRFGDLENPLLVSVRSGAPVSMPGMMDTILNVGITRDMLDSFGDPAFAQATFGAFQQQFGKAVPDFDSALIDDPAAVLRAAIDAVFASWHSSRATAYRAHGGLSDASGTAVTVQAMVFGNRDAQSGTGVAFSRDPSTGVPGMTGDWLAQAQGEAVVAGTHNTLPLTALKSHNAAVYDALANAIAALEAHYADMVDVEFTVESGQLWILQARAGKRSAAAAARIAHDLVGEGRLGLTKAQAVERLPVSLFDGNIVLTRRDGEHVAFAHGLGVSPGLVSGRVAIDCDSAVDLAEAGHRVILVRAETSPEDVHGMGVSAGILTATGGAMSHAALVAREWGIAAVCGADIILSANGFSGGGRRVGTGDVISIDGTTGEVFSGEVTGTAVSDPFIEAIRRWATELNAKEQHHGQA